MKKIIKYTLAVLALSSATIVFAENISVPMNFTAETGVGKAAGTIVIQETRHGLLFTPDLKGLTPGVHGFHIHEKASCGMNGMDAGGHMDPSHSNKHLGPFNDAGHSGDLPALYINADGTSTIPVLAPRLTSLSAVKNHALMVHDGGDNYSDTPAKLGGGGMRMVCGVIK